jgi:hypothetical protein
MNQVRTITISDLLRYPVKGLSPDTLSTTALSVDAPVPGDRRFAIAHGSAPISPANPEWLKKAFFLQLASNPRIALLETTWNEETGELSLLRGGRVVSRGAVTEQTGRTVIEQFFAAFLKSDMRGGSPRLVDFGARSFSDVEPEWISIIGRPSIADLERVVGVPVDPMRFRANVLLEGTRPWEEFEWVGKTIKLGGATLFVEDRIGRCMATHANPVTGVRDMAITNDLLRGFGHDCCGVYARVIEAGTVSVGDAVLVPDAEPADVVDADTASA